MDSLTKCSESHGAIAARAGPTILLCGPPLVALGGGPTHVRNMLASPLTRHYRLVHFTTGSRGEESPAKDEPITAKLFRLLASPFVLAWNVLRTRPDVVHLNSALNSQAFWRDAAYLFVCKAMGRKVIFQLHGGALSNIYPRGWATTAVRTVFAAADAVVLLANCEKVALNEFGITDRLAVIPNAIDTSEYWRAGKRVHSGRVKSLAFLGRLIASKGVFEAIEALETLRSDCAFGDVELRIAGSGPALEGVKKRIKERGLEASVKVVGPVFGSEKVKFLQNADLLLFPSYHTEGLPYTILESLAAGTPVVASRAGGIPEIVTDGVHGALINPRDPRDIVVAIRKLAQSESELRRISACCSEWARQQLGLERLANQFGELYESVRAGALR